MKKLETLKTTINNYDPNLTRIFLPWAIKHPKYIRSFLKLKQSYLKSEKIRKENLKKDVKIQPFLILSITSKCNLKCKGCYASAAGNIAYNDSETKPNLNIDQWKHIIKEASEIGVFGFVIAGGEPFLYPNIIDLFKDFKELIRKWIIEP